VVTRYIWSLVILPRLGAQWEYIDIWYNQEVQSLTPCGNNSGKILRTLECCSSWLWSEFSFQYWDMGENEPMAIKCQSTDHSSQNWERAGYSVTHWQKKSSFRIDSEEMVVNLKKNIPSMFALRRTLSLNQVYKTERCMCLTHDAYPAKLPSTQNPISSRYNSKGNDKSPETMSAKTQYRKAV